MIVIGAGRVGTALEGRASMRGVPCHLVTRDSGWEVLASEQAGPILVTTRNDDLADVVARVPEPRRPDLVFVQNGMLRPWLARAGLQGASRGLLFFAVSSRGEDLVPGGTSPFCGERASAVVRWLQQLDVPCKVDDDDTFKATELEKLIWNSAFGLMCEARGVNVGDVVAFHREELTHLVEEMNRVGGAALGVQPSLAPLVDRLCAYSRSIANYRGAVKEWPWRNGWFVQLVKETGAEMPTHAALLRKIGRA